MPSPKAVSAYALFSASPRLPAIDVTFFFDMRRETKKPLSKKNTAHITTILKKAIHSYAAEVGVPKFEVVPGTKTKIDPRSSVTITEQKKAIVGIKAAASAVLQTIKKKEALFKSCKLLEARYRRLDINTLMLLKKNLGIIDGDFFQMIADLTVHAAPPKSAVDLLKQLAGFKYTPATGARFANPALVRLISTTAPLWILATGRSYMRSGSGSKTATVSSSDAKYYYADTIIKLLRASGSTVIPSQTQIDKVCRRIVPVTQNQIECLSAETATASFSTLIPQSRGIDGDKNNAGKKLSPGRSKRLPQSALGHRQEGINAGEARRTRRRP